MNSRYFMQLLKMALANMKLNKKFQFWDEMVTKWYTPMSFARAATGLRISATNFFASRRISIMLLSRAKSGANGNDATNSVTKPNWITAHNNKHYTQLHKALQTITNDSRLWSVNCCICSVSKTMWALESILVIFNARLVFIGRAEFISLWKMLLMFIRTGIRSVTIQSQGQKTDK